MKPATMVAAPLALLSLAAYGVHTALENIGGPTPNAVTYCYDDIPGQYQAAFFVDVSFGKIAEYAPRLDREIRDALISAYHDLPVANARLDVYTTDPDYVGTLAPPMFSMCRPAKTVGEQDAIDLPTKTDMWHARRHDEAEAAYIAEVDDLMVRKNTDEGMATESPILEQLQTIIRKYKGSLDHLYSLSDGWQNTHDGARFCFIQGDLPSFHRFKETDFYNRVRPLSLIDTDVTFYLVEHTPLPQPGASYCTNAEIYDLWRGYFKHNDAKGDPIIRIRVGGINET